MCKTKRYKAKSGWNEYVEELHAEARGAFKDWVETGRQKHGPLFDHKKRTNANFKYALRFIKRNEDTLRSNTLARKLQNKCVNDFWKEVKRMSNSKTPLPANIDGTSRSEKITQMWQKHYCELFNCV